MSQAENVESPGLCWTEVYSVCVCVLLCSEPTEATADGHHTRRSVVENRLTACSNKERKIFDEQKELGLVLK